MKIDKMDKKLFKNFKRTKFPLQDTILCEEIYFFLCGYICQTLKFRSKGICVYGFSQISISETTKESFKNQSIADYYSALEYLELTNETAKQLNKYITRVEEPVYMRVMKNYDYMLMTLKGVPWFHDAYILNCKREDKDIYVTFALYASSISIENTRIFKLNQEYRYKSDNNNQIAITIKFVNTKLLEGSIDNEWEIAGINYFLWDLEYQSLTDVNVRMEM